MSSGLSMVVDSREPAHVVSMLTELGVDVECRMIGVGDYVLSSECAVERKTTHDFMSSMFSGRLFEQAENLAAAYVKPVIVLEGDVESELQFRVNPRAFWGALLRLEVDMRVPIIPTPTHVHTVDLLCTLAKRLQREKKESIPIHKPKLMTDRDWQVYVVASLPNVGGELSRRILKRFRTVRSVFQAGARELMRVEGIGRAKAERITRLLDLKYNGDT